MVSPPQTRPTRDVTSGRPEARRARGWCGRLGGDGSSNTVDKIASPADNKFMKLQGFMWSDPTAAVLALFSKRGNGGKDAKGEAVLIVSTPAGAALVAGSAFAFDGGLQNCGNGDKYQAAAIAGKHFLRRLPRITLGRMGISTVAMTQGEQLPRQTGLLTYTQRSHVRPRDARSETQRGYWK